jgi:hypothetical protein
LIDRGYVTVFDSDKKPAKLWQKFLKLLMRQKQFENLQYEFHEKIVDPKGEYVVKHESPVKLEEPKPINHIQNCRDIYDWGNQIHAGYGIMAVDKYYKDIIKMHNDHAKANSK